MGTWLGSLTRLCAHFCLAANWLFLFTEVSVLARSLQEALQAKENACALATEFKKKADAGPGNSGKLFKSSRAP